MFFICDHCHYVFSAEAFPHRCPDCGELAIRMANEEESAEHLRLLKVVENDNWDDTVAQRRQESSSDPERQDELYPTHANPQQKTSWDFSSHKKQPVFIRGETIVLRPVRPNDAEFYADLRMHYSMMYRAEIKVGEKTKEGVFEADLCKPESFYCIIEHTASHNPIGYLGIKDANADVWEIAIELHWEQTHKGFGSKSIRLFLNEIHRITGHSEYKALVEPDNQPSQKCFGKIGANLVGLCNGPILFFDEEKERFENSNLHLIDDNMKELARQIGVEPRKLLSHVLEYRIRCPI